MVVSISDQLDAWNAHVIAIALERDEGSLYDHLPATPPDWFAFGSLRYCCRISGKLGCFGQGGGDKRNLRKRLQSRKHKVIQSSNQMLFTNLLTFEKAFNDEMAALAMSAAAPATTTTNPSLAVPGPVTPAALPPRPPRRAPAQSPHSRVREDPNLLPLDFEMDFAMPPFPDVWPPRAASTSPHPSEATSPESPQQPGLWDAEVDEDGDTTLTDVGTDCINVCDKCALSQFCPDTRTRRA